MILDEDNAVYVAELFRTLSDPSRVRIISALLEKEQNVGELADSLGMSHSAVSHQLRGLRQMRIVRMRKEGRMIFYCLDDEHVAMLFRQGLEHVRHS